MRIRSWCLTLSKCIDCNARTFIDSKSSQTVSALRPQQNQRFTDAAFNDSGDLLLAWAYGKTSSFYVWRCQDSAVDENKESWAHYETVSGPTNTSMPFWRSQAKRGRPHLTRVIPYNTYPGCIVATPDIGFFPAQVRSPRSGNSEPQPRRHKVNPKAVCVFRDHSIITVEGRRLKEYKIEYERNHSTTSTGTEICRLATGPDNQSQLLAIKRSDNTIVVIVCNLNMTVEIVKIVPALQGDEEAPGPKHTSTLDTVNNLGLLYASQGKLDDVEKMHMPALQGYEEALGAKHTLTLDTVSNLSRLYATQGRLDEAEQMHRRAESDPPLDETDRGAISIAQTDADSIFTDLEGPQSSVTSFTSGPSAEIAYLALNEFVVLLLSDAAVGGICTYALLLQRLTAERLWRNLKRLLKSFAVDLMKEGNNDGEKAAAALFRSRTSYVLSGMKKGLDKYTESTSLALDIDDEDKKRRLDIWLTTKTSTPRNEGTNIRDRYEANPNIQSTNKGGDEIEVKSDESDESDDESQQEDGIMLPALDSVKTFILRSEAFSKFQQKLHAFIFPSFASELENLVPKLFQELAQNGIEAGSSEALGYSHRLGSLVANLVTAELDSISISYSNLYTRWDQIKLFVESITKREWDWWPFLDPVVPLEHNSAYMCWTCVSGSSNDPQYVLKFTELW
jgi:hypothetical protein